jgi:hypothetical protein
VGAPVERAMQRLVGGQRATAHMLHVARDLAHRPVRHAHNAQPACIQIILIKLRTNALKLKQKIFGCMEFSLIF